MKSNSKSTNETYGLGLYTVLIFDFQTYPRIRDLARYGETARCREAR